MRAWIYLLHFDVPHHHARHYMGATFDLEARLTAHRQGRGSRLTRALCKGNATWKLGGLWEWTESIDQISLWRLEKNFKSRHQGPAFCSICNDDIAITMVGAVDFPIDALPFNPHKES